MTHTFVISKSTELVVNEFYDIYKPEVEMKQYYDTVKPCYVFHFQSGNCLYYPISEYRYEYRSGYAM